MILEIQEDGNVKCLYTDEIDLYKIGAITNIERASHIVFYEDDQCWVVVDADTHEKVYNNKVREKCVIWEVENFGCGGKYYRG